MFYVKFSLQNSRKLRNERWTANDDDGR